MEWTPISENAFDALLIAEIADLSEAARTALSAYGIGRVPMPIVRRRLDGGPGVPERVFAVARTGNAVLFYDDVEEEFAFATVDADEIIDKRRRPNDDSRPGAGGERMGAPRDNVQSRRTSR